MSNKTAKGETLSKKELVEAGRRKLEAYRKGKSAEKTNSKHPAPKEAGTGHSHAASLPLPDPPKEEAVGNGGLAAVNAPSRAHPVSTTPSQLLPVEREPKDVANPQQSWKPSISDSNGAYMATTTTNGRWHVGIATAGQTGGSDSDGAAPVTAQPRSEVAQTENRESALPHTNGAMAGNSASRDDVVEAQDGATPYKDNYSAGLAASSLSDATELSRGTSAEGVVLGAGSRAVSSQGAAQSQDPEERDFGYGKQLGEASHTQQWLTSESQGAALDRGSYSSYGTLHTTETTMAHSDEQSSPPVLISTAGSLGASGRQPESASTNGRDEVVPASKGLPPVVTLNTPPLPPSNGQPTVDEPPTSPSPGPVVPLLPPGAKFQSQLSASTSLQPPPIVPVFATKSTDVSAPPFGPPAPSTSFGHTPSLGGPPSFGKPPIAFSRPAQASAKYVQPPWAAVPPTPSQASQGSTSQLIIPGPRPAEPAALFVPSPPKADSTPIVDAAPGEMNFVAAPSESEHHRVNNVQVERPGGFSSMFWKLADTVAPSAPAQQQGQQSAEASGMREAQGPSSVSSNDSAPQGRGSVFGRFANAVVSVAAPPAPPAVPSPGVPFRDNTAVVSNFTTRPSSAGSSFGGSAPASVGTIEAQVAQTAAASASSLPVSTQSGHERLAPEYSTLTPQLRGSFTAAGDQMLEIKTDGVTSAGIPRNRSRSFFGRVAEVVTEAAAPAPSAGSSSPKKGHSRTDSSAWLDELVASNLGQDALGSESGRGDRPFPLAEPAQADSLVIPSWVGGEHHPAPPAPSTSIPQVDDTAGVPPSRKGSLSSKYSMLSDSYISKPNSSQQSTNNPAQSTAGNGPANKPSASPASFLASVDAHAKSVSSEGSSPAGDSAADLPVSSSLPASGPSAPTSGLHRWAGPPSTSSTSPATSLLPPHPRPTSNGGPVSGSQHANEYSPSFPPPPPISWASLPKAPPSVGKDSAVSSSDAPHAKGVSAQYSDNDVDEHGVLSSRDDRTNLPSHEDGKPHGVSGSESLKHSRRASRDVLQPAVDSSNQFKELQQYIDDLTQEKYELQRGMEQQSKLAASLASENEQLTQDFNNMGSVVQDLRKQIAKYEAEIGAQMLTLDTLARERDGSRSGAVESGERAKALASEVVSLEEQVLQMRSNELRIGKQLERAQEAQAKMARQLTAVQKERKNLQLDIEALKEEKLTLAVKLRRATVAAQLSDGNPPSSRPHVDSVNTASQTDQATTAVSASEAVTAQVAPYTPEPGQPDREAAVAEVAHIAVQTETGTDEHDETIGPTTSSGDVAAGILPDAETLQRVRTASASPSVSPPKGAGEAAASEAEVPVTLQLRPPDLSALLPTKRPWLEQGPGAMAVALGEQERRVVGSINELLERMEEQRRNSALQLKESKAEAARLHTQNEDLRGKLEVTTQRLEVAISHSIYGQDGSSSAPVQVYSGRSGATLAHDDEQAGLGWLMGIFARRKDRSSFA